MTSLCPARFIASLFIFLFFDVALNPTLLLFHKKRRGKCFFFLFFKLPHPCPHHIRCDIVCFERSACASATFLFSASTRLASSTAASSAVLGRRGAGGVGKDSKVRDAPTSSAPGGGGDVVFPSCGNGKKQVREPAGELMLVDACRRLAVRASLTPLRHKEDEDAFCLPDLLVSPFYSYVVSRPAAGVGACAASCRGASFILCFAVFAAGCSVFFGTKKEGISNQNCCSFLSKKQSADKVAAAHKKNHSRCHGARSQEETTYGQ